MALSQSELDWYGLPQGTEYFIASGRNGGTASNLKSAPDNTIFFFPDANTYQTGSSGYYRKEGGAMIPISAQEAQSAGNIQTVGGNLASLQYVNQIGGMGVAPLGGAVLAPGEQGQYDPVTGQPIAQPSATADPQQAVSPTQQSIPFSGATSVEQRQQARQEFVKRFGREPGGAELFTFIREHGGEFFGAQGVPGGTPPAGNVPGSTPPAPPTPGGTPPTGDVTGGLPPSVPNVVSSGQSQAVSTGGAAGTDPLQQALDIINNSNLTDDVKALFQEVVKGWDPSKEINTENILSEFNRIKSTTIDPYFQELTNIAIDEVKRAQVFTEGERARELEAQGVREKQAIEGAQANLEQRGLTFSGEGIKELGAKSAYPTEQGFAPQPGQPLDPVTGQPIQQADAPFKKPGPVDPEFYRPSEPQYDPVTGQPIKQLRIDPERDPAYVQRPRPVGGGRPPVDPKYYGPNAPDMVDWSVANPGHERGPDVMVKNPYKNKPVPGSPEDIAQKRTKEGLLQQGGSGSPYWSWVWNGQKWQSKFNSNGSPLMGAPSPGPPPPNPPEGTPPGTEVGKGGIGLQGGSRDVGSRQLPGRQQAGLPAQQPFGGQFTEGRVLQESRLIASSSQARYQRQLEELQRAAEIRLGTTGSAGLFPGVNPLGGITGQLPQAQQGAYAGALSGLSGQERQNVGYREPIKYNFS